MATLQQGCSIPPLEARSSRAVVLGSVWLLVALTAATLLFPGALPSWALALFCAVCAVVMLLAGQLVSQERRREGSGLDEAAFRHFWQGQALSYSLGAVLLGLTALSTSLWLATVVQVLVLITALLAQLTPFCLGRFLYVLAFERARP